MALSLTPAQLEKFNASSLTTRGLKSSFSHLSSGTVSGETMTMGQIQGKVRRMDSLLAMKRLEDGPYTHQTSSRKRKHDEDTSTSWSDGSTDFAAFVKEVWKRAKGYCGNQAAIRDINARHGGQGPGTAQSQRKRANASYKLATWKLLAPPGFLGAKSRSAGSCNPIHRQQRRHRRRRPPPHI